MRRVVDHEVEQVAAERGIDDRAESRRVVLTRAPVRLDAIATARLRRVLLEIGRVRALPDVDADVLLRVQGLEAGERKNEMY